MKTKAFILFLIFCATLPMLAQNHVGTWRLVSASYTNSKMQRQSVDRTKVEEIKIITPTHFMWMSWVPDQANPDKKVFGGAGGGRYTINGIKYLETLDYASWEGYETNITDFSLRVEGDKMYQMGALSNAEGEKTIIEEEWHREVLPAIPGKHVGTWHLQYRKMTSPDGKETTTDLSTARQVKIISPTHWMTIAQTSEDGRMKFQKSDGGTYSLNGDRYTEQSEFEEGVKTDFSVRLEGDKMMLAGTRSDGKGEKYGYEEIYQREKEIPKKVASRLK